MLIIFSSALMIGAAINQMSGLQMETVFGNSSSFGQNPTTQLIGLTAACVFILSGGLELCLSTAIASFDSLPIGQSIAGKDLITMTTTILQQSFELTVRAVAPAVAALLISTVLFGIISRILPQLGLIQVGMSTNTGLMLTAAVLTMGGCVWLVVDDTQRIAEFINQTLSTFSPVARN